MQYKMIIILTICLSSSLGLKIAFGSCAGRMNAKNSELFYSIAKWQPDAFIWGGDAIYPEKLKDGEFLSADTYQHWKETYETMKNDEGYQALLNSTQIYGTWDDHDYGSNEEKDFIYKNESKELFLEFIDESSESIRWTRSGVYASYKFEEMNRSLKLILLDDRSFHEPYKSYLGEEQWKWLEKELEAQADAYIIMNGVQYFGLDSIIEITERMYRPEMKRLLEIVGNKRGVILLSGDVHYAEIMEYPCLKNKVFEVTSSGLTHTCINNYGLFAKLVVDFFPYTFNLGRRVTVKNWGSIEIDFTQQDPTVQLGIRNSTGGIELEHSYKLYQQTNSQRSYYCSMPYFQRGLRHYFAIFIVFGLPIALVFVSIFRVLKVYSLSY